MHHLVLCYTSKTCRLAAEGRAYRGERNYQLGSVYTFSGPTACQGVPYFIASICLFPQLFKYMKIAYLYQIGSHTHLDLFIVE